jgi:hypothetical protein
MSNDKTNFIEVYENALSTEFCEHVINQFELHFEKGATSRREIREGVMSHLKSDEILYLHQEHIELTPFKEQNTKALIWDAVQKCFDEYRFKYSLLSDISIRATQLKMQRIGEGQGYHVWHCEQSDVACSDRVLVFMVYLNTLSEKACGETEFLYQQIKLNPEEGKVVLWPSAFTHIHRGNPVYNGECKYIITGWFNLE